MELYFWRFLQILQTAGMASVKCINCCIWQIGCAWEIRFVRGFSQLLIYTVISISFIHCWDSLGGLACAVGSIGHGWLIIGVSESLDVRSHFGLVWLVQMEVIWPHERILLCHQLPLYVLSISMVLDSIICWVYFRFSRIQEGLCWCFVRSVSSAYSNISWIGDRSLSAILVVIHQVIK